MKNIDPSDIVHVVQKYSGYVSSLSKKYFIVGGTSEDLFEEGIIGIIEACKNYNGKSVLEEEFESFVKICVKRQITDAIRKANAKKNKVLNESLSLVFVDSNGNEKSYLETTVDRNNSSDPLDLFLDKEKIEEKINHCKNKLTELEQLVLKHYLSGEKPAEIAIKLNKSIKHIDNILQSIKCKIR